MIEENIEQIVVRPSGDVLLQVNPNGLLPNRPFDWCREPDSNRHGQLRPRDFKSIAYTNFAIPAPIECRSEIMEAAPGIEPGIRALQAPALPLGYAAFYGWLRRRINEDSGCPERCQRV